MVELKRTTQETDVNVSLAVDGKRNVQVETGIGFLTIC